LLHGGRDRHRRGHRLLGRDRLRDLLLALIAGAGCDEGGGGEDSEDRDLFAYRGSHGGPSLRPGEAPLAEGRADPIHGERRATGKARRYAGFPSFDRRIVGSGTRGVSAAAQSSTGFSIPNDLSFL